MKKLITILCCFISLGVYAQMQINKPIQLSGSGTDARIEGIEDVSANDHAANKIYVDTAIANRASSGSSCPPGFSSVNGKYCIETDQRASDNWFNATATCRDIDAKLCSYAQWYGACEASIGNNMINDWEWLGELGLGGDPGVAGNGSCTIFSGTSANTSRAFRCCFEK